MNVSFCSLPSAFVVAGEETGQAACRAKPSGMKAGTEVLHLLTYKGFLKHTFLSLPSVTLWTFFPLVN
jgi:hypothetical protein